MESGSRMRVNFFRLTRVVVLAEAVRDGHGSLGGSMSEQAGSGPPQRRPRAPRFGVYVPMEYEDHSVTGRGFTKNVSLSGVLIEQASWPAPIGASLRLRFSFFQGSFETPFRGKVVRHAEEGFAIQFASLEESEREILRTALSPDGDA